MSVSQGSMGRESSQQSSGETALAFAVVFFMTGSAMLVMLGSFHFIAGLAALLDDDFYTLRPDYALEIDVTIWGWIQVVGGAIAVVAGAVLVTGAAWARIAAIVLALCSFFWSFYSIPYYPIWSLLIMVLDVGLLWALLTQGKVLAEGPEQVSEQFPSTGDSLPYL